MPRPNWPRSSRQPENDSPQGEAGKKKGKAGKKAEAGEVADDGSNVVSVDFTRKK